MVDIEAGPKAPKAARTQETYEDPTTTTLEHGKTVTETHHPPVTTTISDKRVLRSASRRGK